MERLEAVLVKDTDEQWATRSGDEKVVDVVLRVQTPFHVVKDHTPEHQEYEIDDGDVVVSGPVYVGDDNMLDRHSELVEMSAIVDAWKGYQNNPVILYNHRKDYGVIGRMLDVTMGEYEGVSGQVPIGRAVIDGGEKDIARKIRKGMLKAFSIGFIAKAAVKECKDEDTCYMKFTEIDWLETSVVDVPASPGAIFNVEKHIQGYEDRGDSIAILFGKSDELIDDEAAEDRPAVVEESACGGCGCGGGCKSTDDHDHPLEDNDPRHSFSQGDEGFTTEDFSDVEGRLQLIEAFIEAAEVKMTTPASVITPLDERLGQGTNMTDAELATKSATEEEALLEEEAVPEEEALPAEAEEVTEVVEATETLEAEATEEESATDSNQETIGVLVEVVKTLANMESRLSSMEGRLASSESAQEEITALKAALDEKDSTILSLTQEKEAAEAEATIEAEVSKRVASTLSSVGVEAPAALPERKSINAEPSTPVVKSTTDFDPLPAVTPGMNGLGDWLAQNLAKRGRN